MIDKLCLTLNISPKSYLIMSKVVLRFFHRHHWRLNLIICNARHAFYRGSVAGDGDDEDVSQSSSIGFCRLNWDPGFAWAYTLMRLVSIVSWCDVHWSQNIRGFYQLCRIGQIYLQPYSSQLCSLRRTPQSTVDSLQIRMALIVDRSMVNKTFILNDLFFVFWLLSTLICLSLKLGLLRGIWVRSLIWYIFST